MRACSPRGARSGGSLAAARAVAPQKMEMEMEMPDASGESPACKRRRRRWHLTRRARGSASQDAGGVPSHRGSAEPPPPRPPSPSPPTPAGAKAWPNTKPSRQPVMCCDGARVRVGDDRRSVIRAAARERDRLDDASMLDPRVRARAARARPSEKRAVASDDGGPPWSGCVTDAPARGKARRHERRGATRASDGANARRARCAHRQVGAKVAHVGLSFH